MVTNPRAGDSRIAQTLQTRTEIGLAVDERLRIIVCGARHRPHPRAQAIHGTAGLAQHSVIKAVPIELIERLRRECRNIRTTRQRDVHIGGAMAEFAGRIRITT